MTTPLYNIGEQAYQVSPQFKREYPQIPWNLVAGVRHRLVHDYEGINWTVIAEIVFSDMPALMEELEQIYEKLVRSQCELEDKGEE